MRFVCLRLSITCSAALTPISQWSVFNLNHIATSPHRRTHWQGQLSWLEVKWEECILSVCLCACVYFILKCVIQNLHCQNGGNTPFVPTLFLLHNLYLLCIVQTNFDRSILQLLAHTDSATCEIRLYIPKMPSKYVLEPEYHQEVWLFYFIYKVLPVLQITEIFLVYHTPLFPLHRPLWPPPSAHLCFTLRCVRAGPRGRGLTARVQGSVCVWMCKSVA